MVDSKIISTILSCLDEYMLHQGKMTINDMEANIELARVGLLNDSQPNPGKPLRDLLKTLRDSDQLPNNIFQKYGSWFIKLSTSIVKSPKINQFQYY